MELIDFIDRALHVEFVEGGRGYYGWDCWGLVLCCQRDVYGILMPSYADQYGSTKRWDELKALVAQHKGEHWERVPEPYTGCLVLLKMAGRPCHIGVMIDERNVLHTEARCNTIVQRIDKAPWRGENYDKIEGFYRYTG